MNWISERGLSLENSNNEEYARKYFNERRIYRRELILKIASEILSLNGSDYLISVGCGYAGEESNLCNIISNGFLIDQDKEVLKLANKFYKELEINNFHFMNIDYVTLKIKKEYFEKCNLIYIAGLSNWMYSSVEIGMPRTLGYFINRNLSNNGTVACLLYGGYYSQYVLKNKLNIYFLQKSIEEFNLKIINCEIIRELNSDCVNALVYIKRK